MTDQPMIGTHKPSMNLRFIEREIDGRIVRILQQMFIPDDWANHPELEEFWRDVPCVSEEPRNFEKRTPCAQKEG